MIPILDIHSISLTCSNCGAEVMLPLDQIDKHPLPEECIRCGGKLSNAQQIKYLANQIKSVGAEFKVALRIRDADAPAWSKPGNVVS